MHKTKKQIIDVYIEERKMELQDELFLKNKNFHVSVLQGNSIFGDYEFQNENNNR